LNQTAQLQHTPGTLEWLVEIMQRLLGPDGCPWDREQTLETLRPYLIEECYEVLDAIDHGDREHHCEELGDLLLQIVFQSQLAEIGMQDVISAIGEKLLRRHPHVFGDTSVRNSADVIQNWEAIKAEEKKRSMRPTESVLDGVPRALPALHRAHQLTRKAGKTGYNLGDPQPALSAALALPLPADRSQADTNATILLGDALLHLADRARRLGVEPEHALRDALGRFESMVREFERSRAAAEEKQSRTDEPAGAAR
jgi:tetrapyrrole methylase family protein/MazG family protein